jgi:lipoprotein-anchoring transpeptidase ErfK/SrfK
MLSRRNVITSALGLAAGLVAGGCAGSANAGTNARWAAPGSTPPGGGPSGTPANLTITPAADATGVSPTQQVTVSTDRGTLQSVTVTAGGKTISGALDADQRTWHSSGTLSYGQTYTVTATVADGSATPTQKTCSFSTIRPAGTAGVTFQANALAVLKTGGTYGVGQPVIVRFSRSVGDKAAAEKAIEVSTSPSVEGKFFWLDGQTVHWRPDKYWAKGTQIDIKVNVLGVNLGKGVYGASNASTSYTIGRSLVAVADANTKKVLVYVDGQLVRTMLTSMGKGGTTKGADGSTIDFFTRTGAHVVLEKDPQVQMTSSSYGISNKNDPNFYDEVVQLATRISYSGEYLHSAPWNHSLGRANLSHGCLNLSPADAQWFFDTAIVGDVVEVKGTPVPLPVGDGLGDWTVPFDRYGS